MAEDSMGRFLLLAGSDFYPAGWEDFYSRYDDDDEASLVGKQLILDDKTGDFDWYEVIDLCTNTIVWNSLGKLA